MCTQPKEASQWSGKVGWLNWWQGDGSVKSQDEGCRWVSRIEDDDGVSDNGAAGGTCPVPQEYVQEEGRVNFARKRWDQQSVVSHCEVG